MTDTRYLDAWRALESTTQPGVYQRRIHQSLPIYATVTNPGQFPGLLLSVDVMVDIGQADLQGTDAIRLEVDTPGDGTQVTLTISDTNATEVFLLIASDLTARALAAPDQAAAVHILIRRFNAWQRYLRRSSGNVMTEKRQLGLFGELVTLRDLLIPTVGSADAVASWTGPDRLPQDFQLPRIAVEVKSIAHGEPQIFAIEGERQLDDFGLDVLALAHHRIIRQKGSGENLPGIIDEIRAALADMGSVADLFDERLLDYGYRDDQAAVYADNGFTLRETTYYRVRPGFPRLVESDLPAGVGGLSYSVPAIACAPYTINVEDLRSWLAEPPRLVTDGTPGESQVIEYKETVWTPVGPTHNDEHARQVARDIQTAVIKTVVAFMNSGGGELVVGIRDPELTVTGIEVDLVARGHDRSDTDAYERDLMTLLTNHIDALAHRQVRIDFHQHAEGTTCHVRVAPSPNPRFGRPLPKPNEEARPHFWVRSGNSTNALEGRDLLDYVAQHWR